MREKFREIEGSITAPKGFRSSGVFCDIKRLGTGKGSQKGQKRDLALIVSDVPAAVAGMFTTNQICAAPVKVCIERVEKGKAQAIVVNSGNANACTGRQGRLDAEKMCRLTAEALRIKPAQVLVGSTGRIGVTLPMANVSRGIAAAAKLLGSTPDHAAQAAEAIMTSDSRSKQIAVEFTLAGKTARIGGICKGAGMIQPQMSANGRRPAATPLHATMLCFLTCDAAVNPMVLELALEEAVAQSFNRINVDGDMSTNDTVLILANGLAGNPPLTATRLGTPSSTTSHDVETFQQALSHVTLELAKMIVRDGEGVSRFVTVHITGAKTTSQAEHAGRAVINSALVKTSWCGGDPNWGRILAAIGYSAADVVEEKVDLGYSAPGSRKILYSLRKGKPTDVSFAALCKIVGQKEFDLHINLNLGRASTRLYSSDLTEEYVDFNKGDVSDPTSLGG